MVRDQMIFAGMSGVPVGINHEAVWRMIDEPDMGIAEVDRMAVFEKVLVLSNHDVEKIRMKAESKNTPEPVKRAPRRRG